MPAPSGSAIISSYPPAGSRRGCGACAPATNRVMSRRPVSAAPSTCPVPACPARVSTGVTGSWRRNNPRPRQHLDVALRVLPGEARPLRHRTPVHIHLGAASVTGRVLLSPGIAVEPGAAAHARIALDGSLGALHGDRFVLRDASAARTLGGGRVIDIEGPRRGAWAPGRRAVVAALDTPDHAAALTGLLDVSEAGVDLDHFARVRNIPRPRPGSLDARARRRRDSGAGRIAGIRRRADRSTRAKPWSLVSTPHTGRSRTIPACRPRRSARLWRCRSVPLCGLPSIGCSWTPVILRREHLYHLPGHESALPRRRPPSTRRSGSAWRRLVSINAPRGPRGTGGSGAGNPAAASRQVRPARMAAAHIRALLRAAGRPCRVDGASMRGGGGPSAALLTVGRFREATGISRNMTMPVLAYFDAVVSRRVSRTGLVDPRKGGACDSRSTG